MIVSEDGHYGMVSLSSMEQSEIDDVYGELLEIYKELNPGKKLELERETCSGSVVENVPGGKTFYCSLSQTGYDSGFIMFEGTEAGQAIQEFKKRFNLDGAEDPAEPAPVQA